MTIIIYFIYTTTIDDYNHISILIIKPKNIIGVS